MLADKNHPLLNLGRRATVLNLGDGLGTGKLALDELGIECDYWSVEINEHARMLADYNLTDIIRPTHDILDIKPRHTLLDWPTFDLVMFGFNCQSLSRQSNGDNLDGSSKILFDCMNVFTDIKHRNPNAKILVENVYSMTNEMKKIITSIIGYDFSVIDAGLVSGQGRKRLYWPNWKVSQPEDRGIMANEILEEDGVELKAWSKSTRYKDEDGKVHSKPGPGRKAYIEDRLRKDGKSHTLVTGKGCKGFSTKNTVITKSGEERDLTVRECARLQSIPDWFNFNVVSENQAYKSLGNGWNLETIKHIIGCMDE